MHDLCVGEGGGGMSWERVEWGLKLLRDTLTLMVPWLLAARRTLEFFFQATELTKLVSSLSPLALNLYMTAGLDSAR